MRWLFRVARCRSLSLIRRCKHMRYGSWQDELGEEPGLPAPPPPETDIGDPEQRAAVSEAVARLPDAYRGVATLFYLHGQPLAEVAVLLGLTRGTAKTRLHRARAALRRRLTA